jgi:hypothetical protein
VLDLGLIIQNLGKVLASQASALKSGNLALDTVTRSVTWNGTLVPYYTDVMKQLTLTANVALADLLKNTIHNFLNGNSNITSLIGSLGSGSGGSGLLSNLTDSQSASDTASAALAESSSLSSKLKRNDAVRDIFKNEHPIKRDAIIDSLAGLYMKHQK